jgi:very-short-patch-repair endonuclease
MTLPEVLLWRELRARPNGIKFRRQHPAGPYVLDFYCEAGRLAIEVDGAVHGMGDLPERDEVRDEWLREAGIRTMRIPAAEVLADLNAVLIGIVEECTPAATPPPCCGRSCAGANVPRTFAAIPGAWRACASPSGRI